MEDEVGGGGGGGGDVSVGGKISAQQATQEQDSADQREAKDQRPKGRDKGDATEESSLLTRSLALCQLGAVGGLGHLAHDAAAGVCGGGGEISIGRREDSRGRSRSQ